MSLPSIFAWCPTYGRPQCVSDIIEMWNQMEYAGDRELLILDDGGMYQNLKTELPDTVTMISIPLRFSCLGEKQNTAVALSKPEQELIVVMEDDDVYMPWTLQAHADAFRHSRLSVPQRWVLESKHGRLDLQSNKSGAAAHAGWAYSRNLFRCVNGYPWIDIPTDHGLLTRFRNAGVAAANSTENFPPYVVCRLNSTTHPHLSRAWATSVAWSMACKQADLTPVEYLPEPDLSRDYQAEVLKLVK